MLACTDTGSCFVWPAAETEIVAVPAAKGNKTPVCVTLTIEESVELHVNDGETACPEVFVAEAENCTIVPAVSDVVGAFNVRFATGPVAGAGGLLTLICIVVEGPFG